MASALLGTTIILIGVALRDRIANEPWLLWLAINFALAWVSLLLSSLAGSGRLALIVLLPLWLLFLPNAPYLVTDLVHLRARPPVPLWVDGAILGGVAILGMWLGVLSLQQMLVAVGRFWGAPAIQGTVIVAALAVGFGVYLGRMLRWNSWDVLTNPRALVLDVLGLFQHPFANVSAWALIMAFSLAFLGATFATEASRSSFYSSGQ